MATDFKTFSLGGHNFYISYSESYLDEGSFYEIKFHLINETTHQSTHLYLNFDMTTNGDYDYPMEGNTLVVFKDLYNNDYIITRWVAGNKYPTENRESILKELLNTCKVKLFEGQDRVGVFERIL